jgi:PEGA domain
MSRRAALGFGLALALLCPSRLHAQKAVLGPAVAEGFDEAVRNSATAALTDALRMQGLTVVMFEEAAQQLPANVPCDEACSARLLRAVSADFSAVVQIARRHNQANHDDQQPGRAQVTLRDTEGHGFEGIAAVRDGDVRDATTRALLEARSYQLLGHGPWLRVVGTPEGAEVLLDGSSAGKLPYRACITPGEHRLVVREAGYIRLVQTLNVPAEDTRKLEVKVALEPTPVEAPAAAFNLQPPLAEEPTSGARDSTWLITPVAMAVLGVGLAAAVSVRLASGLGCEQPDEAQRCTSMGSVRAAPTVLAYGLGAALLGTSITWIALGSRPEQPHMAANIGLDRVAVSGSF